MTTYGKGVVQDILNLGDGTSMKITTANISFRVEEVLMKKGVTPDVEVEYVYDERIRSMIINWKKRLRQ